MTYPGTVNDLKMHVHCNFRGQKKQEALIQSQRKEMDGEGPELAPVTLAPRPGATFLLPWLHHCVSPGTGLGKGWPG